MTYSATTSTAANTIHLIGCNRQKTKPWARTTDRTRATARRIRSGWRKPV